MKTCKCHGARHVLKIQHESPYGIFKNNQFLPSIISYDMIQKNSIFFLHYIVELKPSWANNH